MEPYNLELEVIPGILESQWSEIEKKIEVVKPFAKTIHIDVVDGKFAPNTSWLDPAPFKPYTKDTIFEVHLMVDNPMEYLERFAEVGFRRFIGQVEKMPNIPDFVAKAQMLGEVGLALDSDTPLEKFDIPFEGMEEDIDVAFLMSVKAGLSRQSFIPESVEKIKTLRAKNEFVPIEVDGGINIDTIKQAYEAGATRFVTTGFLFDSENPKEAFEKLMSVISSSRT